MKMTGDIHQLGITPALVAAGASVASAYLSKDKKGGSGGQPGMPIPPSETTTTVSPAFQQSFTPQFAPTMQQQQDSPGATQTAQPVQRASTPQSASMPTGEGAMAPLAPPTIAPSFWDDDKFTPTFQDKNNYQNLIMTGIVAATAIAIATMFLRKDKKTTAPTRKALPGY